MQNKEIKNLNISETTRVKSKNRLKINSFGRLKKKN